jgi:predicted aspartyl protease
VKTVGTKVFTQITVYTVNTEGIKAACTEIAVLPVNTVGIKTVCTQIAVINCEQGRFKDCVLT